MKKFLMLLAISSTFVFMTGCTAIKNTFAPDARSILEENSSKIASTKIRQKVESAVLTYSQTSADGTGILQIYFRKPNQLRIENIIGEDVLILTLDGTKSWSFSQGKVTPLNNEEIEEMSEYLNLLPFREKPEEFFEKCTLEKETEYATGVECYVIHAETDDGIPVTMWISKSNMMTAQIEVTAPEGKYTTQYFEYKDVEGVKVPSRVYIFDPIEGAMLLVLQEAEINSLEDDSVFERPETFDTLY